MKLNEVIKYYLGTDLKIWFEGNKYETVIGIENGSIITKEHLDPFPNYTPVLYKLDLRMPIIHDGKEIIPIVELENKYPSLDLHKQLEQLTEDFRWVNQFDFMLIDQLIKWHIDVFGLIEGGEAIAVTDKINPYK